MGCEDWLPASSRLIHHCGREASTLTPQVQSMTEHHSRRVLAMDANGERTPMCGGKRLPPIFQVNLAKNCSPGLLEMGAVVLWSQ